MASAVRLKDGSYDFSGGVDSGRVTTVQSAANPHGLPRTMLAWLTNATVRGGGILQRTGWTKICKVQAGTALYQCGYLYEPSFADPHLILAIGGRLLQVRVDTDNSVRDLSTAFGLVNPAGIAKGFMTQGEQYLVVQAGDLAVTNPPTLPLFWDGTTLRRSRGIAATTPGSVPSVFTLTTTAAWVIPAVNSTVVVSLSAAYTGLLGDKGTWRQPGATVDAGTFIVTAIGATTITLKTVTSTYISGTLVVAVGATFTTIIAPAVAGQENELPAATAMVYYQGRLWYAQGRIYTAGDIVGGPSGSLANQFKDAILKVTENPLALGGDGFAVPSTAGDIRALSYSANLDSTLGQGPLYIFTRRQVYQLVVPITRQDWIAATSNNAPLQTIAQKKYGTTSDRCVVAINGDLFYQSLEPAIRSLFVSIRYFQQWGNVPISRNLNRVLKFNDRALMSFATGIEFDNRLWQGLLPVQTPVGVAFQAIAPLDFDIISSFGQEEAKPPPAWEGILEGLDILQLFEGDFGGRQRAFAAVHSRETGDIEVWEFTDFAREDTNAHGTSRVSWFFETPAYTWGKEFELKQLDGGEVWIDKVAGTVEMTFEYRVDADPCWQPWFRTQFCAAKSSCEDVNNPVCYPLTPYCEGYRFPITLPSPEPGKCDTLNKRPTNQGYQFQMRVTVKGWCRVRGFILFALPLERLPFQGLNA